MAGPNKAYTVTVGGQDYDVDAPDEKTAWKWANAAHFKATKSEGNVQKPPTPFRPSGETALSGGEEILANPYGRAAVGALKPVVGIGQLALNMVGQGEGINREMANLKESTGKAREYVGSRGIDLADMAGQGAAFAVPAGMMRNAATTAGRIGQGMAMGAGAGAAEPVSDPSNYWGQKGVQVGAGTLAGGAIPGAWELAKMGGRGIRNVVQPYMGEWGADRAAGRLANAAAGDKANQVISSLQNPQIIVPNSRPTAGQAAVPAGSAEFSALQQIAAQKDPSKYGVAGIEGAQQDARQAAVRSVGQTPADLKAAEVVRQISAKQNYGQAYQQAIKGDQQLMKMSDNPYFKDALGDATKLAEAKGIDPKNNLTQFLHYVKISLDKQLSRTGDTALASTEKEAVQNLKSQLTQWIGQKNPQYDKARQVFANQSKPINQMEVGQYLEQKLANPLETGERAGVYAQALRDAPGTLKRSTGQPRYDELGQVLTPQQTQSVTAVGEDLKRAAMAKALAKEGGPAMAKKITGAVPEVAPTGFFDPRISFTRGLYNRLTGNATDKILADLAKNMDKPQKIAEMMQKAKPFERQAIVDALMRYQATVPAMAQEQQ